MVARLKQTAVRLVCMCFSSGNLSAETSLLEGDQTEGDQGIKQSSRIIFQVEKHFAEKHIGHIKTTQDAVIVWHFSSAAEAASRNEAVSTIPQIQFRFLIAWGLSALLQEIIDQNRNGLLVGILSGLVW